jgi:hypothetical protein
VKEYSFLLIDSPVKLFTMRQANENCEFIRLGINQSVDYDKYYLYSLITHSTAIEGSTLTEMETQLLFDEGVTAFLYFTI